jgi:hypothetical protein
VKKYIVKNRHPPFYTGSASIVQIAFTDIPLCRPMNEGKCLPCYSAELEKHSFFIDKVNCIAIGFARGETKGHGWVTPHIALSGVSSHLSCVPHYTAKYGQYRELFENWVLRSMYGSLASCKKDSRSDRTATDGNVDIYGF